MTESRQEFLARVAEAHYAWEREHADAPFVPENRPGSGDYNVWNVDLESDGATQDAFFEAVGTPNYEQTFINSDAPEEEVNPDVGTN